MDRNRAIYAPVRTNSDDRAEDDTQSPWFRPTDWYWLALTLCLVTVGSCAAYNRWTPEGWKTPLVYEGDAWVTMALGKAFSGEVVPMLPKHVASLGAPFVANWSDFPNAAEGILTWYGLLVRIFGVFTGSNMAVLSAHLLAAASFFFVCRVLGYRASISVAGAVLFSLSRYALVRNLPHLGATFYWHVPLGLLVVWWCIGPSSILNDRRKVLLAIFVAVAHGIQDPYYIGIFLQFLVLASLVCVIRRDPWAKALTPLVLGFIVFAAGALVNVDVIYYRLAHGPNPQATVRSYNGLEQYALKPVELLVPYPHRVAALDTWAQKNYFAKALYFGEVGSTYLGVIGLAALAALAWSTVRAIVNHAGRGVPGHFWLILWIFVYSVTGGLNGFLGLFGILLLRGTNRYAFLIFAVALLFLVRQLTFLVRRWRPHWIFTMAVGMTLLGFLDQTVPPSERDVARIRERVLSDSRFVSTLEARVPALAMVFELPVSDFPEVPPTREMQDYEHFRPYLHSQALRFSYGNVKGRPRERWLRETKQLAPGDLVATLERYGFAAILINKKAYDDRAALLLSGLRDAGRGRVLAESNDLISIGLHPRRDPLLPPEFDEHWRDLEGNLAENSRWSTGNAKLTLHNARSTPKRVRLAFYLESPQPRNVDIYAGPTKIYSTSITSATSTAAIQVPVSLSPGPNELFFRTENSPSKGEPRKDVFALRDFKVIE